MRLRCSKCYCRARDSPKEGKKRSKVKAEIYLDLCKPRRTFSINFLKSRLWQGR